MTRGFLNENIIAKSSRGRVLDGRRNQIKADHFSQVSFRPMKMLFAQNDFV